MYEYFKGEYAGTYDNNVVVECGGVGYKLTASQRTIASMPEVGEPVTVYAHLSVKEDAMELYGFGDKTELKMFRMLLSVTGVGPKAAISILSQLTPSQLASSILSQNQKAITAAPGVGPKVAQRIMLELGDKVRNESFVLSQEGISISANEEQEALDALMALGYNKNKAQTAIKSVYDKGMSTEQIIRAALKNLMK